MGEHYCMYKDGMCELDIDEAYQQGRADAIDECIKTVTDYCGGLPNNNLINELEKLKEQK